MIALIVTILVILCGGLALGLYVAVTIGYTALGVGWIFSDRPMWDTLSYLPWNSLTTVTLLALPLFILMGEILLRSGVTDGMYDTLSKWLNRLPGGLLHTNIVASAIFSCVSGSSPATAATIGSVAVPFMAPRGYDKRLMLGSLAAGGTLGNLIPPSIVFIVYGVMAGESVSQLYIAGIVPGLLLMACYIVVILFIAIVRPEVAPREAPTPLRERMIGLLKLIPILTLIVAVLGTMYIGIATPTEAAAFGVTGALLLALVNRRVTWTMLRETLLATAATTAMIMFILVGAFLLQFVITFLGLPSAILHAIEGMHLTAFQFVVAVCIMYLILGAFMEELSMIFITVPILVPVLQSLGVDLVWFGVLLVILVEAGMVVPPVGLNLFILQGLAERNGLTEIKFKDVVLGVLPFIGALLFTLVLILLFPQIALFLVQPMQ